MSVYAVYVLKTNWCWDNYNDEYATITVENPVSPSNNFDLLSNPNLDTSVRDCLIQTLLSIAEPQNQCPMNRTPELVTLYKIENPHGIKRVNTKKSPEGLTILTMQMRPICNFQNNKPVPVN